MKQQANAVAFFVLVMTFVLSGCPLVEGRLAPSTRSAAVRELEPVGFAGTLGDLGDECGHGVTVEVADGIRRTRDYCYQQWMSTSDPRFTGSYTRLVNVDEYIAGDVVPDGVSLWVSSATHRLENDGGAWLGDATASITIDDVREGSGIAISPQVVVFTGSGGYEGLTAIAWWQPQGTAPGVRGVIIPDPLPPVPPSGDLFPTLPAEE